MPFYEYRVRARCGQQTEAMQKVSDRAAAQMSRLR
jgi:predicted nucleic acid-binding Zn ribbon protein